MKIKFEFLKINNLVMDDACHFVNSRRIASENENEKKQNGFY
jgi:hypothetical protein